MWDNAYAVHDHHPRYRTNKLDGTLPSSRHRRQRLHDGFNLKVTLAGAGISFLGGSKSNLDYFVEQMSCWTIGPDKVNQLRHARLLPDLAATKKHMLRHAEITRPKFELFLIS